MYHKVRNGNKKEHKEKRHTRSHEAQKGPKKAIKGHKRQQKATLNKCIGVDRFAYFARFLYSITYQL